MEYAGFVVVDPDDRVIVVRHKELLSRRASDASARQHLATEWQRMLPNGIWTGNSIAAISI
jgi:hypothetical protein